MSKITYVLMEDRYCNGMRPKAFYGIQICDASDKIVATVWDISADRERLSELVQKCNLLELSPIHLYDVIEDFLTE